MTSPTVTALNGLVEFLSSERTADLLEGVLADHPLFETTLDGHLKAARAAIENDAQSLFIEGRAALLLRVMDGAQAVLNGKPRDELARQHAWDTVHLCADLLGMLGMNKAQLQAAATAEGPNPVITSHANNMDDERDNGWYWQYEHSRCDLFGPYDTRQRARDAGTANQTDPD